MIMVKKGALKCSSAPSMQYYHFYLGVSSHAWFE